MNHRFGRAVAAVCSLGLAGAAIAPATASAQKVTGHRHAAQTASAPILGIGGDTQTAQTANADFTAGPFHVQFNASRAAGAADTNATGTFHAEASLGPTPFMTLTGPVTCLDVVGNRVGLFYPVTSVTPTIEGAVLKGVYIYAQLGPNGTPQAFNFAPSANATTIGCAPIPSLIPINSGTLKLTS